MARTVFAGLAGGGSVTECVLCDENAQPVGAGRAGPCNTNFVSEQEARETVEAAVAEAFGMAGSVRCVAAGVAVAGGFSVPGAGSSAAKAGLAVRCEQVLLYAEHQAALAACGVLCDEGVAVVAGTGSSAVAYRDGRSSCAGGWGALLGDEGSGYAIAVQALRAATRSCDGAGPKSAVLEQAVAEHFGLGEGGDVSFSRRGPEEETPTPPLPLSLRSKGRGLGRGRLWELVRIVYPSYPRQRIAALTERLASLQEDPVIASLFLRAAADLGAIAVAAASELYAREDRPLFAMSGGVWKAGEPLVTTFCEAVLVRYPGALFAREERSPAHGLAIRAMNDWRRQ